MCKYREEVFWKQRSPISWLQEGDMNTNFFHSFATTRKRNNRIQKILCSGGRWVESGEEIAKEAINYFQDLFTKPPSPQDTQWDMEPSVSCLSSTAILFLSQPYTETELTAALHEFHPSKAPGPDGLPASFYRKYCPLIKPDVVD